MATTQELVTAVRNTLDSVAVSGVENMRKMVLCYDTLEHIANRLDPAAADEMKEKEEPSNG